MQSHDPVSLPFILACVSGAIVAALRTKASLVEKLTTFVIGVLVAYNIGPLIVHLVGNGDEQWLMAVGCAVGMLGKEIAELVIDRFREYAPELFKIIFRKR